MFKFGFAEDVAGTAEGTADYIFVISFETHVLVRNLRLEHYTILFPRIFNSYP